MIRDFYLGLIWISIGGIYWQTNQPSFIPEMIRLLLIGVIFLVGFILVLPKQKHEENLSSKVK